VVPEVCVVVVAIDLYHYLVDVAHEDAQETLSVVVVIDVRPLTLQPVLELHSEVHMACEDELAIGL
jgi:hypothetical protein